ncbi:Tip elongation aberrant protein Tea4 [Erysiphe necator]|nr:Tip elongation aberrant protein Tea4 [Erysiphe necator]
MNREWDNGETEPSKIQIDPDISNKKFSSQNNRKSIHGSISSENPSGGQVGSMGQDDEDKNGEGDDGNDDDMMDKISSSPSIEDEDIDYEFVYALHTFIATIEGQANATKGDTMVLLDDSNSYWWLVRVVKDSSIGYLPAEHIETPTERLARLNKHRNIDLTSTMLGDQPDRYKTPLIKAFRKRSTKTVAFADPTYVEASDIDYTTDEDEEDQEYLGNTLQRDQIGDSKEREHDTDESVSIESPKANSDANDTGIEDPERDRSLVTSSIDVSEVYDESTDGKSLSKTRDEPLRSADPIFPDDSVETRKLTLTPDLLRDDSSSPAIRVSNELREIKRPSHDRLERDLSDKAKDKKERKEKKSGMLSGLFKRKDRKNKSLDEDIEEILGMNQLNDSLDISPVLSKESDRIFDEQSEQPLDMQLQTSRLQKQSSFENSSLKDESQSRESKDSEFSKITTKEPNLDVKNPKSKSLTQSNISIESISELDEEVSSDGEISGSATSPSVLGNTDPKTKMEINADCKPIKLKQAKSRVELDDFGSSQDTTVNLSSQVDGITETSLQENSTNESLPLIIGIPNQEDPSSPKTTSTSESATVEDPVTKTGVGSSTTLTTSNFKWSDNHLRSFFEDDSEIKDMLIIVYDNTGVTPAGPEHPLTANLFKEENIKLTDIANRLDSLLEDWLARKSQTFSEK